MDKMKKALLLVVALVFCLTSCSQSKPSNLEEAINYFESNWSASEINEFKNKPENDAVSDLHHSVGTWIRNEWIRHGNEQFREYFKKIGVFHPDDISTIVFTSLHRKLNKRELNIEKQVKYFTAYWEEEFQKKNKTELITLENYRKYQIGDKINIYFPVEYNGIESNAVVYESNEYWEYNPKKDLKITGIIKDKYYLGNEKNVFFKIKLTAKSNKFTKVQMEEMQIGNIYEFQLSNLKIDK